MWSIQAISATEFPQRSPGFGKDERGPDEDLRLQFEAVSRFDEEEKRVVRSLLEGMILKHEARRWQTVSSNREKG